MGGLNWGGGISGAGGGAAAGTAIAPGIGTGIGAGLGGLLGLLGGGNRTQAGVPSDLAGARGSQINLLQSLLQPYGGGNAFSGISNYFGNLGVPQTDLQRQATGGISQFLNQPSPEMRALQTSRPVLEGMLTGTGPQFERDIALANQQGGRFSSANEILRGEALRNLYNLRNTTANTLGMLSGQAGTADFSRLLGGYGIGTQEAGQADIGLARLLQAFSGLFSTRQQMVGELPISQRPSLGNQLGATGGNLAMLLPWIMQMAANRPNTTAPKPGTTSPNPGGEA